MNKFKKGFSIYVGVLLVLILMPLMMIITKNIGARSGKNFVAQQKAVGALNGFIEETIEGQRVVQVFCHEEKAKEEFSRRNEDVRIAGTRAHTFASLLGPIMNNLSQCGSAIQYRHAGSGRRGTGI